MTRKTIGQALGIVMERYDLDADRAFALLVRAASNSNIKLRDVAQELVEQKTRPAHRAHYPRRLLDFAVRTTRP